MLVEALAKAGMRGLLATGGGALSVDDPPSHIHIIDQAPHDRLFPHVAATLHHGGAGTTAASLRAGLPTILCPFFGDQPFWARRVAALGAGPPALDRNSLSVDMLAAAFAATADPAMRARASVLGEAIRRDDGVGAAIDFIESRTKSFPG
jgi:UDP:flavonoid glycosyltransferase YjiC (YdhE family)